MPSLRGLFTCQTSPNCLRFYQINRCFPLQRPGIGGMIPNRDQEADIKIFFTQPPRIQAELLRTPRMMGYFTLSFMIEKSFLPVIYHRCSRILPISILLELTVFPAQLQRQPLPPSHDTQRDGSRDVAMRGWGFNSPGRGRDVRAADTKDFKCCSPKPGTAW